MTKKYYEKKALFRFTKYGFFEAKISDFLAYMWVAFKIYNAWFVVYSTSQQENCEELSSKFWKLSHFKQNLLLHNASRTYQHLPGERLVRNRLSFTLACKFSFHFPSIIRIVFGNRTIAHSIALSAAFKAFQIPFKIEYPFVTYCKKYTLGNRKTTWWPIPRTPSRRRKKWRRIQTSRKTLRSP